MDLSIIRRWIINWGVIVIPVLALALAGVMAWLGEAYSLPIFRTSLEAMLAIKITFLSIIMALGMFQYRYFYDEATHLEQRAKVADFGPGWAQYAQQASEGKRLLEAEEARHTQMESTLNAAREAIQREPSRQGLDALQQYQETMIASRNNIDRLRNVHRQMDEAIQRVSTEFRNIIRRHLLDFNIRLSLIFSVGILLFLSLACDVGRLIFSGSITYWLALYSQSAFVASLQMFFILFLILMIVVQSQLRYHNRDA